jgi:hydrogenase nickel incorporation protein HypB
VDESVSNANDEIAAENRRVFDENHILCVNLMGSPGSGKTTLIECLAPLIGCGNMAVIQGDLESDIDTKRMQALKIICHQINTHSGCHLNAKMLSDALSVLDLSGRKYLFIENVGNLVCPAKIYLGQHLNIVVSSTAEGHDKPLKYAIMFMDADLTIIAKSDLKDAVNFDSIEFLKALARVSRRCKTLMTSKKTPESFEPVRDYLIHERQHIFNEQHSH